MLSICSRSDLLNKMFFPFLSSCGRPPLDCHFERGPSIYYIKSLRVPSRTALLNQVAAVHRNDSPVEVVRGPGGQKYHCPLHILWGAPVRTS